MIDDAATSGRDHRGRGSPSGCRLPLAVLEGTVAMAVVDPRGSVVGVTARWCALTGLSPESLTGGRWSELADPPGLPPWDGPPSGAAGEPVPFRLHLRAADGTGVPVQAQASRLAGADDLPAGGWLVTAVPVADDPASGSRGGAEGSVDGRPPATEPRPEGSDLVASVSHELRNPLTSIVSFTDLLRDGLETDGLSEQREFLDIIQRNSDRLLRLVDDLLLLDRLESGAVQPECEDVDLPTIVEVAALSIGPAVEDKGLVLDVECGEGPPLRGDVGRLGQLVDNLLANAVKFTLPRGSVRVTTEPLSNGWRLVVSDTGIGVPADEQGKLFRRFYRASNARQDATSGSGLGLVIARRIAEMHRGSIELCSDEGRGTTVTVELRGMEDGVRPEPSSTAVVRR